MNTYQLWISFYTILRKDIVRIFRIWPQTFLPSVITSVLYFLVFGTVLGTRIGDIGGYSYIQFVVPGLVMLGVVTNSFSNVATTFFQAKFFSRNIDEILVSPTPPPLDSYRRVRFRWSRSWRCYWNIGSSRIALFCTPSAYQSARYSPLSYPIQFAFLTRRAR